METERLQDADGLWQTRTSLPPLPMASKSTNAPMPEAEESALPSQATLRMAEERARAKRLAHGHRDACM